MQASSPAMPSADPPAGGMPTGGPPSDAMPITSSNPDAMSTTSSNSDAMSTTESIFDASVDVSTSTDITTPSERPPSETGSGRDDLSEEGSVGSALSEPLPPPTGPPAIVELWTHFVEYDVNRILYHTSIVVYWQNDLRGLQYFYTTPGQPFQFVFPGDNQRRPANKRLLLGVTRRSMAWFHEQLNNHEDHLHTSDLPRETVNETISTWITDLLEVAHLGDFEKESQLHINESPYSWNNDTKKSRLSSIPVSGGALWKSVWRNCYYVFPQSDYDLAQVLKKQCSAVVFFVDAAAAGDYRRKLLELFQLCLYYNNGVDVRVPVLVVPFHPDDEAFTWYGIDTSPTSAYAVGTTLKHLYKGTFARKRRVLSWLFDKARRRVCTQKPTPDGRPREIPFRARAAFRAPTVASLQGSLGAEEWRLLPFTTWFQRENELQAQAISVLPRSTQIVAYQWYQKPVAELAPIASLMHCEIGQLRDPWKWTKIGVLMRLLGVVATALVEEQEQLNLNFVRMDGKLAPTASALRSSARETLAACSHLIVTLLKQPGRAREGMQEYGCWEMMYIVLSVLSSKDRAEETAYETEKFLMLSIAAAFNYVYCATFLDEGAIRQPARDPRESPSPDVTMLTDCSGLLSCGMTWASVLVTAVEHWQERYQTVRAAGSCLSYWNLDNLVMTLERVVYFSPGHCPPLVEEDAEMVCELLEGIKTNIEHTPKPPAQGEHVRTAAVMERACKRIGQLQETIRYVCILSD